MLHHLIIHFSLHYLSSGRLREVIKAKENFKILALKVVALAYERWSLTRGSKYSDLTGKLLVYWKLVAEERWSQSEVRLYKIRIVSGLAKEVTNAISTTPVTSTLTFPGT